jgi:hypothetical protein
VAAAIKTDLFPFKRPPRAVSFKRMLDGELGTERVRAARGTEAALIDQWEVGMDSHMTKASARRARQVADTGRRGAAHGPSTRA